MITAESNRAAILDSLRSRGVRIRLVAGQLEYQDCGSVLEAWEKEAIEVCREGLTAQLRLEAGLCVRCGGKIQDRRATVCHACIMAFGMPIHQRLMADKRIAAAAKKQKPKDAADTNPDFAGGLDLGE